MPIFAHTTHEVICGGCDAQLCVGYTWAWPTREEARDAAVDAQWITGREVTCPDCRIPPGPVEASRAD